MLKHEQHCQNSIAADEGIVCTCALERRERAVLVAKDVEQVINQYGLQVKCGTYLENGPTDPDSTVLSWVGPNCRVCALGAMFVARLSRFDKNKTWTTPLEHSEGEDDEGKCWYANPLFVKDSLTDCFDTDEILEIEAAFEGFGHYTDNGECCVGEEWCNAIPDPKARLSAICANIIKNDGIFLITQLPEPVQPELSQPEQVG